MVTRIVQPNKQYPLMKKHSRIILSKTSPLDNWFSCHDFIHIL